MAEFKLGRIKFVYQGAWADGTDYVPDDVVTVGGKSYICVGAHTASALFDTDLNHNPTYWNLTADGTQWRGPWAATTTYNLGDLVLWGGVVYLCNTGHTSATYTSPLYLGLEDNIENWDEFAASFNWLGTWATSTRYKVRDLVVYGGITYVCNEKHISASSASLGLENDLSKWDTFNQGLTYLGTWSGSAVRYKLNDIVKYGADLWICTEKHTSTGTAIDGTKFSIFVNGFEFVNSWDVGTEYIIGDVVTYGGFTYTAVQNGTGNIPSSATAYWKVFTSGLENAGIWANTTSYKIGQVVLIGGFTYVALQDSPSISTTVTATAITDNLITLSSATGIVVNMSLTVASDVGGIDSSEKYYVKTIDVPNKKVTLSLTPGGATVTVTSNTSAQTIATVVAAEPPNATYWSQLNAGIRWNPTNRLYNNSGDGISGTNITGTGFDATFNITTNNTNYTVAINNPGNGYAVNNIIKILGTEVGGLSPVNDLMITVTSQVGGEITAVTVSGYAVTWVSGTVYVQGDAVYWGNSTYICVSAHVAAEGNRPDNDITSTNWNLLAGGADSGVLTTTGDIVYYGNNGPTRLPIGSDGQVLRVNNSVPAWSYYGLLDNMVFIAANGVDQIGNGQGLTIDKPWASVAFAAKQIEEGYLNTDAGTLLEMNKQFMMKEVNNFILYTYTYSVGTSSTTAFTLSSGTTSTMNAGMPITFSAATGGVVPGIVYYVYSIDSSTEFKISETYSGSSKALTAGSVASTVTFSYDETKAERDTGQVIDALIHDLTHGGNLNTQLASQAYFANATSFITQDTGYQITQFIAALTYLKTDLLPAALTQTAPDVNYQTLNSVATPAVQITNDEISGTYSAEDSSLTTVQTLLGIITSSLSAGTYTVMPSLQKPNTTIYVKTGTYNEHGPIVVPHYTAIVGDELRSTIIQAAGADPYLINDVPKTIAALERLQTIVPTLLTNSAVTPSTGNTETQIVTTLTADVGSADNADAAVTSGALIQNMLENGVAQQPSTFVYPAVTGYNTSYLATYSDGRGQITQNYQFIIDEIVNYLNNTLTGTTWSAYGATYQAETIRDLTYILDGIVYDMSYGCNDQSQINGRAFYTLSSPTLFAPYTTGVLSALARLSTIIGQIVQKTSVTVSGGNLTAQVTTGTAGSASAAAFAQARIANILYWINNGYEDTTSATFTGSISSTTLTVSSVTGTVKIGQIVTGGTVAAGTYITAGSGSSWTVSVSQTATATGSTMTITPIVSGASALATTENQTSFNAVQSRLTEIASDAQAWVQRFYQSQNPGPALTIRDAGYIASAISYDMLFGSNFASTAAGRRLLSAVSRAITLQSGGVYHDATYGAIGFIKQKVKYIAAAGSAVQAQLAIDDMVGQLYGQPTTSAVFNGTINGTLLTVNSVTSGTVAIGMQITGIGIATGTTIIDGGGSDWIINYSQSVSALTTVATGVADTTNYITLGTTNGVVPGLEITFAGDAIGNLVAGTYYVSQVLSATQLTISSEFGGSVFNVGGSTITNGSMTVTVYGLYGGIGLTTEIVGTSTNIPVTAVTTSTNDITVDSTTGMYVNQPITFSNLPANKTTTASAVSSSSITLGATVASLGVVVGQKVWFTGVTFGTILADKVYYVKTASSSAITISATLNGTALTLVNGTGTMNAYFNAAGGLVNGNQYWINSINSGSSTITVTDSYNSGTEFVITDTILGLTATAVAGVPTVHGLAETQHSGTNAYNNTQATAYGGEILRANNAFIQAEIEAYVAANYGGTVTGSNSSNNRFTTSTPHNLSVNDPVVFSSAAVSTTASQTLAGQSLVISTSSGTTITVGGTSGVTVNQPVVFSDSFGSVVAGTVYYVYSVSGPSLEISTAAGVGTTPSGGGAFTVGTGGTGTATVQGTVVLGTTAGLGVGSPMSFTGTSFGGLSTSTQYYVANVINSTRITLATTNTGAPLTVVGAWTADTGALAVTAGDVFGGIVAGTQTLSETPYWVLSVPTSTTFTITSTAPGTGTQTEIVLPSRAGNMTVTYFYITENLKRYFGHYIDGLVYDLNFTGNYKSLRFTQLYQAAQAGATTNDLFLLRNATGLRNMTLNGLAGSLSTPNEYGTRRPTAGSYSSLDAGFGPNDANAWISTRSPYTQNLTLFGSGCTGMKIDSALHNGGNKSIVANDYTTILSDGVGVWCTGSNSLVELVSVFNYYGYAGYIADLGGRIRATNGNSSYGTYGVIAENIDSFETPIVANLDNRANPAYITNVVTDTTNEIFRIEYENAGSGYTNYVPTINGSGYNAVAVGDEFRDAAVFETRLVDIDNGQGVGGNNYVTNANSAQTGELGNITIANTDTQLSSAYVGMRIQLTAGTGVGQYANVLSYSNGTKIAKIYKPSFVPLTITASSTTVFTVASTRTLYAGQPIYIGANFAGLTAGTIYYVSTTSLSSTQFRVSDTAAHGVAGTNEYSLTAVSATPAVMSSSTIVGTTLTVGTLDSGTIAVGQLLTGSGVSANTYITANISGSGAGSTWTVSVSQSAASTTITGTVTIAVYEAGWDHVIPGKSVTNTPDLTTSYIIEPAISYTAPGFTSTARTLIGTATWGGVAYGAGKFVATAAGATTTNYSSNGTSWSAGGALPSSTAWGQVAYGGGQGAVATAIIGGLGGVGAVLTAIIGTGSTAGQITGVTVVNGGANYTTPPTIVFTPVSGGTGASATCAVRDGAITSVTMNINGAGYTNGCTVTATTGQLSSITADTWGKDYFVAPTVTVSAPVGGVAFTGGGTAVSGTYYYYVNPAGTITNYYLANSGGTFSGSGPTFQTGTQTNGTVSITYVATLAIAEANLTNNGVSSFTILQTGYGYTSTPTVTITDPQSAFVAISTSSNAAAYQAPTALGTAWTSTFTNTGFTNLKSLAYGNNLFVAVGGTTTTPSAASLSGDPSTASWINRASAITTGVTYSAVAYGAGTFVAVPSSGTTTSWTTNAATWTAGGNLPSKSWTGVAYGNGRFVAIASDGTVCYSIDFGVTWATSSGAGLGGVTTWSNLRYAQGQFFAVATSSQACATSWDGINWVLRTTGMPSSSNWTGLTFGNPDSTTLGAVPTWVSISATSGTIAASIATGATALGRVKIENQEVTEIRMIEPGSGYPRGNVTGVTGGASDIVLTSDTSNLLNNQPVVFNGTTTDSGIVSGKYYYVVSGSIVTNTSFQISLTSGGSAINLTTASFSGVTYFASPITTQTDPNKIETAPVTPRIGNGALGNPSFSNRGTANTTATASVSGDGYAELYQVGTYVNVSGLYAIPTAGCNVVFSTITGANSWYKLVSVSNILGVPGNYTATFQINPGLTTLLAPPHNTVITTNLKYSQVRLTGHDFLYIGTGNQTATNYPNVDPTRAIAANQSLQTAGGRVFFTSTDQDGNFNVGNLFGVQQSTGTATLNASAFNLSGLQSLTLGNLTVGVGSATITQFSTDPYFTANSDNIVPTQKAIKAFITAQIGGGASSLNVNTLTAGQVYIAGNTIQNTTGGLIYVNSKMYFTGGVDGAPVALVFFGQR